MDGHVPRVEKPSVFLVSYYTDTNIHVFYLVLVLSLHNKPKKNHPKPQNLYYKDLVITVIPFTVVSDNDNIIEFVLSTIGDTFYCYFETISDTL
jgi:hypothetical protein